jgi:hypothetical protein
MSNLGQSAYTDFDRSNEAAVKCSYMVKLLFAVSG